MDKGQMIEEYIESFDSFLKCIERANSSNIINHIPWGDRLIRVARLAISLHYANVLHSTLANIPEGVRPHFIQNILPRVEVNNVTYLTGCMDSFELLMLFSYRLCRLKQDRCGVGAVRITSLLSRLKYSDYLRIDYHTLMGVLSELKQYVLCCIWG